MGVKRRHYCSMIVAMDSPQRNAILRQNPWWEAHGQRPRNIPNYPKGTGVSRTALDGAMEFLTSTNDLSSPALLITGLRQVGKTTVLQQALGQHLDQLWAKSPALARQVAYVKLDDMRLEGALSLKDILDTWDAFRDPSRPSFLFLDEVQKLADRTGGRKLAWAEQIKGAIDDRTARIIATGSRALELEMGRAAGAGRWQRLPMLPLSFQEFLLFQNPSTPPIPSARYPALSRYLVTGGLPRFAGTGENPHAIAERLRSIVRETLAEIDGVRTRATLRHLAAVLLERATEELNVKTLGEDLGIKRESLLAWLQHFEDGHLLLRLPRIDSDSLRELRGNPKVYTIDPGLASAFSLAPDPLDDPRTRGRLVETAVFRHLHELEWKCQGQLRFYQERKGRRMRGEIDFVLIARDEVFALEITSAEGGVPSKASYVASQLKAWNSSPKIRGRLAGRECRGAVIHMGAQHLEGTVPGIPLADFLINIEDSPLDDPSKGLRDMTTPVE